MSPFERMEQYDVGPETDGDSERRTGHQIFVDELERFATEVADSRCAAIADRLAAPLRVAVSGRRGVGRSTLAQALARIADVRGTIAVTCTESAEADVDVYVIAEVVKPEDRDAIGAAARPVVAVLNKADLIATTEPGVHPHGPTGAARTRCARLSAHTGLPIQPVVGLLAVAALDDLLDDTLWAALQVLATRPAGGGPVGASSCSTPSTCSALSRPWPRSVAARPETRPAPCCGA